MQAAAIALDALNDRGAGLPTTCRYAQSASQRTRGAVGLQGTFDTLLAGRDPRSDRTARARPARSWCESPDGHGTLYTSAGRFCAGEAADYSGPVDDRHALDVRLIDVCFHLMRFETGSFGFAADERRRGPRSGRPTSRRSSRRSSTSSGPGRRSRRCSRASTCRPRARRGARPRSPDPRPRPVQVFVADRRRAHRAPDRPRSRPQRGRGLPGRSWSSSSTARSRSSPTDRPRDVPTRLLAAVRRGPRGPARPSPRSAGEPRSRWSRASPTRPPSSTARRWTGSGPRSRPGPASTIRVRCPATEPELDASTRRQGCRGRGGPAAPRSRATGAPCCACSRACATRPEPCGEAFRRIYRHRGKPADSHSARASADSPAEELVADGAQLGTLLMPAEPAHRGAARRGAGRAGDERQAARPRSSSSTGTSPRPSSSAPSPSQVGLEFVDLSDRVVDASVASLVTESLARRYQAIPVGWDDGRLVVAMADPSNVFAVDDIRALAGADVRTVVATAGQISETIDRFYRLDAEVDTMVQAGRRRGRRRRPTSRASASSSRTRRSSSSSTCSITQAVNDRASDIHVEPPSTTCASGSASTACSTRSCARPQSIQAGVISRLKVMADINIAERRIPQDGRISHEGRRHAASTSVSRRCRPCTARRSSCESSTRARRCCSLEDLASCPRRSSRFESVVPQALRHDPRDRPDRFGQVDDALRDAQQLNDARPQHHHGRGPGRVPAARHQPGADQPEGRPHVRRRRCGRSCVPTPTSCSSVRSATARPRSIAHRSRAHRSPRARRRCTPTTPRRRRMRLVEMGVEPFLVTSALDCVRRAAARPQALRPVQGAVPADRGRAHRGRLADGADRRRRLADAAPRRRLRRRAARPATGAGSRSTR